MKTFEQGRPYTSSGFSDKPRLVKIVADARHKAAGHKHLWIEERDFDPKIHVLFDDATEPK